VPLRQRAAVGQAQLLGGQRAGGVDQQLGRLAPAAHLEQAGAAPLAACEADPRLLRAA
jgi:hypothetical protein